MDSLEKILEEIEIKIPYNQKITPNISNGTVGWQLSHSLKVIEGVLTLLINSDPKEYRYKFNLSWLYIGFVKQIPRGRAKAPAAVNPKGTIEASEIERQLKEVYILFHKINTIPAKAWFTHPYFGAMNKKNTLLFLRIHSKHHLKIIEEIIESEEK